MPMSKANTFMIRVGVVAKSSPTDLSDQPASARSQTQGGSCALPAVGEISASISSTMLFLSMNPPLVRITHELIPISALRKWLAIVRAVINMWSTGRMTGIPGREDPFCADSELVRFRLQRKLFVAITDSDWFNYLSDSYRGSVQTTERYIGCRQNLREAVNDRFRISPSNNAAYEV